MTATSSTISPDSESIPPDRARKLHQLFDRTLVILFVLAISLPLIGTWRHWDKGKKFNENRNLAPLPSWPKTYAKAKLFLPQFFSYYRDHFGFRSWLIQGQMETTVNVTGVSPNPMVAIGTNGWIYWCPPGDRDYAKYRGLSPLTEAQLDAWQTMFEGRRELLLARHIPYLIVFVPEKQTIYSEYMPPANRIVKNVSLLDQLLDRLQKTNSPVHVLDLRPELFNAK